MPAAIDPGRRPMAPEALAEATVIAAPAQTPPGNPVFEVDKHWFGGPGPSGDPSTESRQSADTDPQATIRTARPLHLEDVGTFEAVHSGDTPEALVDRNNPVSSVAPVASPPTPVHRSAHDGHVASDDVADAFAALLAEEQGEPIPVYADSPTPDAAAASPSALELTDEAIERIADRVVQKLTHGMLGFTVNKVVSDVSERLVKEEIQRIRTAAERRA
jgi:hypothetical protein